MHAPLQCKVAILFKQRNLEFSLYALNFDGTYATYIHTNTAKNRREYKRTIAYAGVYLISYSWLNKYVYLVYLCVCVGKLAYLNMPKINIKLLCFYTLANVIVKVP